MEILIVAATTMEIKLIVDELEKVEELSHLVKSYRLGGLSIDILIAGIGTSFTTFHLVNALRDKKYDAVINIGVAGSLTRELKIGEVVNVYSDEYADLGIEKQHEFLTLFESGYLNVNEFPFENGQLKASNSNGWIKLKKVKGITTNKSYGRDSSITEIKEKFTAHVESMEGAAVFYVCNWLGVSCYQLRSVSNYVEPRDSEKWNIPLALENLKEEVIGILRLIPVPVN
ncbi:futalosine hydrolase [uncultured Draconibacterium sp.]|uniref:futalosine hydrolase n=1 Tax=uncultured Draconibacterium sp. TaxID=1573823 RepID=UPI0025CD1FE4|nr:futalosine hydrolase [uncultured Draconibacterium sp.]